MYLFEDAELKTIFNMAEMITELEPEPLIEQEAKDQNVAEEKREMISQNGNLIILIFNRFILSICFCLVTWWLCIVSLSVQMS